MNILINSIFYSVVKTNFDDLRKVLKSNLVAPGSKYLFSSSLAELSHESSKHFTVQELLFCTLFLIGRKFEDRYIRKSRVSTRL